MIIVITGKPRTGKTALLQYFLERERRLHGHRILRNCNAVIDSLNANRENKLPYPDRVPAYTNFKSLARTGYNKTYSPYWLNPYWLGLPSPGSKTQRIFPVSSLFITEARKYWDGRESMTMPDNVSQVFEAHGHWWINIYIDLQRGKGIDLQIRANASRMIEVQCMHKERDAYGRIITCKWFCREFKNLQDYEAYISGTSENYKETTYFYRGNIFKNYESRNRKSDFIPSEEETFSNADLNNAATDKTGVFASGRPTWYRKKPVEEKDEQQ